MSIYLFRKDSNFYPTPADKNHNFYPLALDKNRVFYPTPADKYWFKVVRIVRSSLESIRFKVFNTDKQSFLSIYHNLISEEQFNTCRNGMEIYVV